MAYDKTTFQSGLAMGLCGKGEATFEASDVFGKGYITGAKLRAKRVLLDAPTLKPAKAWLNSGNIDNHNITEINFVDRYTPTGSETKSWAADVDETGAIMCYVNGTVVTVAGNGSGKIMANEISRRMFSSLKACVAINGIELIDTSRAIEMYGMFLGCSSLTSLDLSSFDTNNVSSMYEMFVDCTNLTTIDLTTFCTNSVTSFGRMFLGCSSLTSLDLSSFDTRNATYAGYMFTGCENLESIYVGSGWDTSNMNTRDMFEGCGVSEVTYKE